MGVGWGGGDKAISGYEPDGQGRAQRAVGALLGGGARGDPGVGEDALGAEALVRLLDEQPADEVLGLAGDAVPLGLGELVLAPLDAGEEHVLAGAAVLAALPAAVGAAVAGEGRVAAEQDVHDDAEAPEVAALVVVVGLADERLDDLRGHELGAAHRGQQLGRRDGRGDRVVELDARAQVEVADLYRRQLVRVHAEDVLRLEVPVRYACGREGRDEHASFGGKEARGAETYPSCGGT